MNQSARRAVYVEMSRALWVVAALPLVLLGTSVSADDQPAYPLDALPRVLAPGESLPCSAGAIPLVHYAGTELRYQKPVNVHPAFQAHLAAFEHVVAELAQKHYGRVPTRIVHIGSFNCRKMRRYPDWVSEHALGNAIDIAGFDFAALPRSASAGVPAALRRPFRVRVEEHWRARARAPAHAAFLHDLARTLAERPDVFSVVLGPGYPGHENHLHLDAAPYRVIDFEIE